MCEVNNNNSLNINDGNPNKQSQHNDIEKSNSSKVRKYLKIYKTFSSLLTIMINIVILFRLLIILNIVIWVTY